MKLRLIRDDRIPPAPDHLYGMMEAGSLILQTMERPWVPEHRGAPCGEPRVSCVPVGTYDLVLHDTPAHPQTFALVNAELGIYHELADAPPGEIIRVACLLHAGNFASQSEGCVLVGLGRSVLNGQPDVTESRKALQELLAAVPWVLGHTLTIE